MARTFFIGSGLGTNAVNSHFKALSSELARRGHSVLLLAPRRTLGIPDDCHVPVATWPSKRPTRLTDALFLWKLLRQHRPDCLVANFAAVNWMCSVAWLRSIRCRVAWYHTLDSQTALDTDANNLRASYFKKRKRIIYQLATHLAVNSRAALGDISTSFGIRESKCSVWPNSLPDPLKGKRRSPQNERANVIVCAGRFDHSKGQDVLVDAFKLIHPNFPHARIEFLGGGRLLETVRQRASDAGVASQCVFRGIVSHAHVLDTMAGARLTVVPSRAEAFGLVNIESMAVGTPVVASEVGGITGIVRHGIDGLLVKPDDPLALAQNLEHLLTDQRLAETLGENARSRFLDVYEQSRVVPSQADWLEAITQE